MNLKYELTTIFQSFDEVNSLPGARVIGRQRALGDATGEVGGVHEVPVTHGARIRASRQGQQQHPAAGHYVHARYIVHDCFTHLLAVALVVSACLDTKSNMTQNV